MFIMKHGDIYVDYIGDSMGIQPANKQYDIWSMISTQTLINWGYL